MAPHIPCEEEDLDQSGYFSALDYTESDAAAIAAQAEKHHDADPERTGEAMEELDDASRVI